MADSSTRKQRKGFDSKEYRSTRHPNNRDEVHSNHWRSKYNNENNHKIVLTVKANKVGKIIGRQGAKIKEIQSSTNTVISIGKREDLEGNVNVTIIGDNEGNEKCVKIIEKIIEDSTVTKPVEEEKRSEEEEPRRYSPIDWETLNRLADEYEKVKWADCPPIKKNFYYEDNDVANMNDEYVVRLRRKYNNITVKYTSENTDKIPNPVETFSQAFSHYPEIMREIDRQKFDKPFPIQAQAWPILLSGKDMIGIAQTGTGKTLAFLLPALIHTDGQKVPRSERGGPNVLILAPTRELAQQIDKELQKYSYRDIKSVCVYGGGSRQDQIDEITKGVQIIIATPGRLNDLVQAGVVKLKSITFLVLDEADRMLDLGFEPQIRKLLLRIRPDRQTVMTSATWPFVIQNLAETQMVNPVQVVIGSLDLAAVHTVTQIVHVVHDEEKFDFLLDIIENMTYDDKIIVFVERKSMADTLACDLILKKINCDSIHGDREQTDREQAIDGLKTGEVRILIATDIASRGIDIADITKVLNYDFPRNIEEYVHRVGRTGRAGKRGEAITFFTKYDSSHAKGLISILEEADQEVPDELIKLRDSFQASLQKKKFAKINNSGKNRSNGKNQFGGLNFDNARNWW